MNDEKKRYWVGINMIRGITPRRFHVLLNYFSDLSAVWNASESKLREIPSVKKFAARLVEGRDDGAVNAEMRRCRELGIELIALEDDAYPETLRAIPKPPPLLYMKGQYRRGDRLAIGVVGTRKYTNYGKRMAEKLSGQLSRAGFTVVSGMARGIDTFSHQSTLNANGRTVAVMGTGFGVPYPRENVNLMRRIAANGAVFSEFPLDQGPSRWSFPQRNRVISGLSRGVLVVEAPARSGALITAHDALNQGREVFAVPGDARKETMRGTHGLIKDGAKLVEDVADVVEEFNDLQLRLPLEKGGVDKRPDLTDEQKEVYEVLGDEPIPFNEVLGRVDFPPGRLSHIIFQLEIDDLVERSDGNLWAKAK
ncbi:MAG: DNA-processing protein DprA [Candidatus Acetothermia bacterium]